MFTIIPVKPFAQTKTRLAPLLSPQQRADLSRYLLKRTIKIARQVGEVVVVSRDSEVRQVAKAAGAWALVEAGRELNDALHQAAEWARLRGAAQVLILPNDLPLLTVADLRQLINAGSEMPAVVISPCRRYEGTNALLLRPPGLISFAFGRSSFVHHQQLAHAEGLEPLIYISPNLALDLDIPADLRQIEALLSLEW